MRSRSSATLAKSGRKPSCDHPKRHRGQSLALLTVVFGYVGGAASPVDSRKVDRSILIVAEGGDFQERSNSYLNSKAMRI
jgi:hypothetical protein